MRLRSRYDREIFLLALPALGALAAEPLYVLVDHRDRRPPRHQPARRRSRSRRRCSPPPSRSSTSSPTGTTAQVSRLHGAGRNDSAAGLGSQALWLALAIGVILFVLLELTAPAVVSLMGGEGTVKDGAVTYLRISAIGAPLFMLASAAQGFLRGMSDLRTPLYILLAAHTTNVVLELLFVYGFDWGLKGSAWGTVIAQLGMALAFFAVQYRAGLERPLPDKMRPLMRIGSEIAVRTTALTGSFLIGSAVLARIGTASLGAHQIAFQLWVFLALVLDAIAIAGQVMVGRMLGADDADGARAAANRMIGWSVVVGALFGLVFLALGDLIPRLFTSDDAVIAKAHEIWPLFVLMMPFNGAVFALDGILIGAGDTRFLMWGMLAAAAVYIPIVLLTLHYDWGIVGVWWGLVALIAVRLVTCAGRFASSHWALTGAPA